MVTIAVIGLGYVGLPLAVAFGRKNKTIGFDLDTRKIDHYRSYYDPAGEVSEQDLRSAVQLTFTTDPSLLAEADFLVVAVPTPIDSARRPDLRPLIDASSTAGRYMKRGAVVVFESTVYPGATEEVCIPELEAQSGMKWMQDFHVGYSPERINPGDRVNRLETVVKVVSGDDADTLEKVTVLYESVGRSGCPPSIQHQGCRGRQGY